MCIYIYTHTYTTGGLQKWWGQAPVELAPGSPWSQGGPQGAQGGPGRRARGTKEIIDKRYRGWPRDDSGREGEKQTK